MPTSCPQVILGLDADAKKQLAGLQRQVRHDRLRRDGNSELLGAAVVSLLDRLSSCSLAAHAQLEVARQLMGEDARKSAASGGAVR